MSVDWNQRYTTGDTPWEKGAHHPGLPFLLATHLKVVEKATRILVPGCGFGYDADLIGKLTSSEIFGLDIAEEAIRKARERSLRDETTWGVGDLFDWAGRYDLVFEHTCFCAIPIDRRQDYVSAMGSLIPLGGHLLGIFFLNPDHEGEEGPPFGVTMEELHDLFGAEFELVWFEPPAKTFSSREGEGRELCMLWQKKATDFVAHD
ncbi:MAG: TPMT family class I SAM-dependent methyltransferase [Akkermansiaceae bacterium]|jgi:SAM-dependent methyltransferase|nr:TPMT family class I SAM-dependent methyltransferase [Akkermansiaceae bacterium]